jgi:hypothetical protein
MSDSWVSLFFSRRDLKDRLFFEWLRCPRAQNGISSIGVSEVGPSSPSRIGVGRMVREGVDSVFYMETFLAFLCLGGGLVSTVGF